MHYLTLGSILKQEETYMMDFVCYHRHIGIQHFVFFDREYYSLKEMFPNDPDIEIIHFPDVPGNTHQEAWGQLIDYNKGKTKWLALIDADQCVVPVQTNDIKKVLTDYEAFASLQCNWRTFGSSYLETREPGSIYERFLYTAQDDCEYNYHTQFICQPDRTLGQRTPEPHYPLLPEGEIWVNTNKEPINPSKTVSLNPNTPLSFNVPPLYDVLYINHYNNKSREEWVVKNSKGRADIFGDKIPMQQFEEYDAQCNQKIDDRAYILWQEANKS